MRTYKPRTKINSARNTYNLITSKQGLKTLALCGGLALLVNSCEERTSPLEENPFPKASEVDISQIKKELNFITQQNKKRGLEVQNPKAKRLESYLDSLRNISEEVILSYIDTLIERETKGQGISQKEQSGLEMHREIYLSIPPSRKRTSSNIDLEQTALIGFTKYLSELFDRKDPLHERDPLITEIHGEKSDNPDPSATTIIHLTSAIGLSPKKQESVIRSLARLSAGKHRYDIENKLRKKYAEKDSIIFNEGKYPALSKPRSALRLKDLEQEILLLEEELEKREEFEGR